MTKFERIGNKRRVVFVTFFTRFSFLVSELILLVISLQIIMEKQLKCVPLLSLKDLALRRVSVLLWSSSDILASIAKFDFFSFGDSETEWREVTEDKIKNKVLNLDVPKSLMKPMIDILRPMSANVRRWAESHKDYFLDSWEQDMPPDVTKLCWTAAGTIDNRKTAEKLLHCNALHLVELSYELACFYCLEDYIPYLWEKLSKARQNAYYNYKGTEPRLQSCWPHILKGELSKLDYLLSTLDRNPFTFYQYVFEYSAENGNRTATEYFFRKLTFQEREDSLMRTSHAVLTKIPYNRPFDPYNYPPPQHFPPHIENISSVFCYLLSVMTPLQQMEIFESRPLDVLFSFLHWPWQDLFLENLSLFWTFLPPSSYGDLLLKMTYKYTDSDFCVSKLYQELFIQSPLEFKKCFVDQEHEYSYIDFLCELCDFDDSETLGVIFRNLDAEDRVKLVFHHEILDNLIYYLSEDNWPLVEVCLREAMLSKEDKERLKKSLMEYLKCGVLGNCENRSFKKFFQFLDNPDANVNEEKKAQKRKLENSCAE